MDESRKVIRVFLASPGDLKSERVAAKNAVDELNQSWLAYFGYYVELVGWELTVAAVGRPQALINRDLDACEHFIGAVWKRWGTPPAKDGCYQSGFEEEYERSLKRYERTGRPEISLFFKAIDPADTQDPGPQLQRVIDFKNKVIDDRKILFEEFNTVSDFEARVRRCIFAYIRRLIGQDSAAYAEGSPGASGDSDAAAAASFISEGKQQESPLPQEGMQFLREFTVKLNSPDNVGLPTPAEVARFRLLGTLLATDVDDPLLAVHDANRLFTARNDLNLGVRECLNLLDAALAQYENENVPLWHWLSTIGRPNLLYWRSLIGHSEAAKIGALSAMRDVGADIPTNDEHPRSAFIGFWFDKEVPSPRRAAALRYLADFGVHEDLSFIRNEHERKDYHTSAASIEAIIRITLRDSRAKAFAAIVEWQPDTLDEQLIASLFANTTGVGDKELEAGISHKSSAVRLAFVRELVRRGSLREDLAVPLLDDSSVDIRLEAVKELTRQGRIFSRPEIEKLLIVREQRNALFMFGGAKVNNDRLKDFQTWQRTSATDRELEEGETLYNRDGEFVLDERHFASRGDAVRVAVSNEYKDKFETALAEFASRVSVKQAFIDEARKLERFVRQRHTRQGLDVLCRRGDARDLVLVREIMDRGTLDYSDDEVMFLQRYGEWEDIPRIIAATDRITSPDPGSNTLLGLVISPHANEKYAHAATAIYALGRKRADELFLFAMPDQLRRQLILEMPDAGFATLRDATILECFRSKDASVRKAVALKSVRVLTRSRQSDLLNTYLKENYRFYNVILWLDLGVSMPREIARATALRLLNRIRR